MEHISRRTMRQVHALVLVSDYSIPGIRSAKRIHDLAKELGIQTRSASLVINKASGSLLPLEQEIADAGLSVASVIPHRESLVAWNIANKPIFAFDDQVIAKTIAECMHAILPAVNDRAGKN